MKRAIKEILVGLVIGFGISASIVSCATNTQANEADTYLSKEIQMYCQEIGEMYSVCPELLMAIIETESSGRTDAKNGDCIGLMQISSKWHKARAEHLKAYDMWQARNNILIGCDYLAELLEEHGDIAYCLDIYNGNSQAKYNYENGIMSEYATKVLERSAELERLHKK